MAVASATDLSRALMPASKAAISSASVAKDPSISAIAVSESEIDNSNSFFLSSELSNLDKQYSFLLSSADCSFLRFATISSIIEITLSKPIFLPLRANSMRSSAGCGADPRFAALSAASACARCVAAVTSTCTKLALAEGSVFLKSSNASSSLRTLMVSASAANSSVRKRTTSSHSFVFVSQPYFNSAKNLVSAASDSFVSSRSFSISAFSVPRAPTRSSLSSICPLSAATSFFFAAIKPS
mmetsp:Transcript_18417/g.43283  ORF Transcript_18417/g.43283 Transcript_18417/m.43283 type:complete len:241 (-) Transcript_18417:756-1478(-)